MFWTRSQRSHSGNEWKKYFEQTRGPQIPTVTHVGPITDQIIFLANWHVTNLLQSIQLATLPTHAWRSLMSLDENLQFKLKFQYLIYNLQSPLFLTLTSNCNKQRHFIKGLNSMSCGMLWGIRYLHYHQWGSLIVYHRCCKRKVRLRGVNLCNCTWEHVCARSSRSAADLHPIDGTPFCRWRARTSLWICYKIRLHHVWEI